MYVCKAYGLWVSSDFCLLEPFKQLPSFDVQPDVVVRIGSNKDPEEDSDRNLIRKNRYFKGYLPEIGQFWIRNGTEIIVEPTVGVDVQMLSSCILGSAFSVLLQQRGFLVLHASAAIIEGQAIAFIGSSGAGKSTTASAFMQRGYSVITDDVLAIQFSAGHPTVIPSYPVIKLLPDAVKALGNEAEDLPLLYRSSRKRIQEFEYAHLEAAYPLRKIYALSIGERHEIEALSATETLFTLVNQSRAVKNLIDSDAKKLHFQQCAELAKTQCVFRLNRKPGLDELAEIVKLVEIDLGC
jgi:preprotein translocase subunit Sss1